MYHGKDPAYLQKDTRIVQVARSHSHFTLIDLPGKNKGEGYTQAFFSLSLPKKSTSSQSNFFKLKLTIHGE
jgi:hypothetical protein